VFSYFVRHRRPPPEPFSSFQGLFDRAGEFSFFHVSLVSPSGFHLPAAVFSLSVSSPCPVSFRNSFPCAPIRSLFCRRIFLAFFLFTLFFFWGFSGWPWAFSRWAGECLRLPPGIFGFFRALSSFRPKNRIFLKCETLKSPTKSRLQVPVSLPSSYGLFFFPFLPSNQFNCSVFFSLSPPLFLGHRLIALSFVISYPAGSSFAGTCESLLSLFLIPVYIFDFPLPPAGEYETFSLPPLLRFSIPGAFPQIAPSLPVAMPPTDVSTGSQVFFFSWYFVRFFCSSSGVLLSPFFFFNFVPRGTPPPATSHFSLPSLFLHFGPATETQTTLSFSQSSSFPSGPFFSCVPEETSLPSLLLLSCPQDVRFCPTFRFFHSPPPCPPGALDTPPLPFLFFRSGPNDGPGLLSPSTYPPFFDDSPFWPTSVPFFFCVGIVGYALAPPTSPYPHRPFHGSCLSSRLEFCSFFSLSKVSLLSIFLLMFLLNGFDSPDASPLFLSPIVAPGGCVLLSLLSFLQMRTPLFWFVQEKGPAFLFFKGPEPSYFLVSFRFSAFQGI